MAFVYTHVWRNKRNLKILYAPFTDEENVAVVPSDMHGSLILTYNEGLKNCRSQTPTQTQIAL